MNLQEFCDFFESQIEPGVIGWFYPQDVITFYLLNEIQIRSGLHGDMAELGCCYGKSAIALGHLVRPDERLHIYDFFGPTYRDVFFFNMERFCPDMGDRMVVNSIDLTSLTAPPDDRIAHGAIRFLHIDAGHSHKDVINDLRNFAPMVANGGIIVLDDFFHHQFPGIATAGTEFMLSPEGQHLRPFAGTHYKLYLCDRTWLPFYQRWLYRFGVIPKMSMYNILDVEMLLCFSDEPWNPEQLKATFDDPNFGTGAGTRQ
jgi:hypothetical protein